LLFLAKRRVCGVRPCPADPATTHPFDLDIPDWGPGSAQMDGRRWPDRASRDRQACRYWHGVSDTACPELGFAADRLIRRGNRSQAVAFDEHKSLIHLMSGDGRFRASPSSQ